MRACTARVAERGVPDTRSVLGTLPSVICVTVECVGAGMCIVFSCAERKLLAPGSSAQHLSPDVSPPNSMYRTI